MTDTPSDPQGHREAPTRDTDEQPRLDIRRDVLTPDLRSRAEDQGRDPEEVDPISDDQNSLRLASLGGSTSLD